MTQSNWNISGADLYDLFGKYGPIRQVRIGNSGELKTKGTAYVVYESPDDAKEAINHLNGFHLMERYIVGESQQDPTLGRFCVRVWLVWSAPESAESRGQRPRKTPGR